MPIDPDAYMDGHIPTLSRGGSWVPHSASLNHASRHTPTHGRQHSNAYRATSFGPALGHLAPPGAPRTPSYPRTSGAPFPVDVPRSFPAPAMAVHPFHHISPASPMHAVHGPWRTKKNPSVSPSESASQPRSPLPRSHLGGWGNPFLADHLPERLIPLSPREKDVFRPPSVFGPAAYSGWVDLDITSQKARVRPTRPDIRHSRQQGWDWQLPPTTSRAGERCARCSPSGTPRAVNGGGRVHGAPSPPVAPRRPSWTAKEKERERILSTRGTRARAASSTPRRRAAAIQVEADHGPTSSATAPVRAFSGAQSRQRGTRQTTPPKLSLNASRSWPQAAKPESRGTPNVSSGRSQRLLPPGPRPKPPRRHTTDPCSTSKTFRAPTPPEPKTAPARPRYHRRVLSSPEIHNVTARIPGDRNGDRSRANGYVGASMEGASAQLSPSASSGRTWEMRALHDALPPTPRAPKAQGGYVSPLSPDKYDRYDLHPAAPSPDPPQRVAPDPAKMPSKAPQSKHTKGYIPIGYAEPTREVEWNRDGPAMKTYGVAWKRDVGGEGLQAAPEGPRRTVAKPPAAVRLDDSWWAPTWEE